MESFTPKEILSEFDVFLHDQGLKFDGVLVGGAAVTLAGYRDRMTADIDLLTPIPDAVKAASREFAKLKVLSDNWFNNRVVNLRDSIPFGWQTDLDLVFEGRALKLSAVSRLNLIKMKMFAYCDRQIDYEDLEAMKPTSEEFKAGELWILGKLKGRERNAAVIVLDALEKRLGLTI